MITPRPVTTDRTLRRAGGLAIGAAVGVVLGSAVTHAQDTSQARHADARIDQVFGLVDPASAAAAGQGRGDRERPSRNGAAAVDLIVDGIRFPRPKPSSDAVAAEPLALLPMGGPLELVAGAPDPTPDAGPAPEQATSAPSTSAPSKAVPELVAAPAEAPCLKPDAAADGDGDLVRNARILGRDGMCITENTFDERKRHWTIQTVASGRPGPLWVVAHDDEDESFDTAVYGLQTYGGTLLAVETGGKRNNDGIDPNRNFAEDGLSCGKMDGEASPLFTGAMRALFQPGQLLFAVHNAPPEEKAGGRRGHASVSGPPRGAKVVPSEMPGSDLAGDADLVLLAATASDRLRAEARAKALAQKGVNVIIESVGKERYDCSLSNYAAMTGGTNYFNVTIDPGESDKQRKMVDMIVASFGTGAPSQ